MRRGRSRDGEFKSRKRKLITSCFTTLKIDAEILSVVKHEVITLVNDVCTLLGEDVKIIEDEVSSSHSGPGITDYFYHEFLNERELMMREIATIKDVPMD